MKEADNSALPMIQVSKLSKWYGHVCALREVSFSLSSGETLVIYGENGAGKSTLLQCLAGVIRPTAGEINCQVERPKLGVVLQRSLLYGDLTIGENVLLAAVLLKCADPNKAAENAIRSLGLEDVVEKRIRECSYGTAKRASIARAIVGAPGLLLLDEPFSSLDTASATKVVTLLQELRQNGRGIIVVTHDVNYGENVGTRFSRIERGVFQN